MRPVVKDDGAGRVYSEYQDALDDLAEQIGLYCSYCEMPIMNAPEVEHVQPKSLEPQLALEWSNFLLGCKSCNSTKGNKQVNLDEIAFPDTDNTFRGLTYNGDRVAVTAHLTAIESSVMKRVVELVKLHRHPAEPRSEDRPSPRDRRFKWRGQAWLKASKLLEVYLENRDDAVIRQLITDEIAPATGFFSVWMTVFREHPSMLRRFIDAFPGTAKDCFDADGSTTRRPGSRI